jgi:L-fuculose-phosphate aldolase
MNDLEARRSVAEAGRMLLTEGLVARTWGNVSCRTGEKSFVITPSGLAYEGMTADDVVPFDMETGKWEGERKPSSEKGIHAAAYRHFPGAGFIIHTHQVYASALSLAGFDPKAISEFDRWALGGVALARYGLPGTKKLRANVARALSTGAHVVLMAQHGALIIGANRDEAFERAKRLETVAKSAYRGDFSGASGNHVMATSLLKSVRRVYPDASFTSAPAVVEAAADGRGFRAQLDDMAQMIGPRLVTSHANPDDLLDALKRHGAVLVPGVGAFCRAETTGDCEALKLLVEKSCVAFLHTRALGAHAALSPLDARLMRAVYRFKYSKKA